MRNKVKAILFNLFCPGLGFIYLGKIKAAIITYFSVSAVCILFWSIYISIDVKYLVLLSLFIITSTTIIIAVTLGIINKNDIKKITKWYFCLLYLFICAFVITPFQTKMINKYMLQTFKIPSSSMNKTLIANDRVVTNNLAYQNEKPKRFEVVTFYYPEDAKNPFLARIVGLPGETIEIVENTVFINDTKIPEPYIIIDQDLINQNIPNLNSLTDMPKTEIPEFHYFVMGDNRINSYDSRLRGSVMEKDIFGKVEKIYWSDDMKRIDKNLNMYAE